MKPKPGDHPACLDRHKSERRCVACRTRSNTLTRHMLAKVLDVDRPDFDCHLRPWLDDGPPPAEKPKPHAIQIVSGKARCTRCPTAVVTDTECLSACAGTAREFSCSGCRTKRRVKLSELSSMGWAW